MKQATSTMYDFGSQISSYGFSYLFTKFERATSIFRCLFLCHFRKGITWLLITSENKYATYGIKVTLAQYSDSRYYSYSLRVFAIKAGKLDPVQKLTTLKLLLNIQTVYVTYSIFYLTVQFKVWGLPKATIDPQSSVKIN